MRLKYSQLANIIFYGILVLYLIDIGNWKYVFAYLGIGLLILLNYCKNGKVKLDHFRYEFKWLLYILATFIVVTVIKQMVNGFNSYFINEIIYYITPLLFIFAFLQLQDEQSIFPMLNGLFAVFCLALLIKVIPNFSLEAIKKISFSNSYSPFEGTGLAYIFTLYIFYFYYRKNLPMEIASLLLVFVTMKRMAFVASVVIILLSIVTYSLRTATASVRRWVVVVACIAYIALPVVTSFLLNDGFANWFQAKTGLDLNTFTLTRFFRLNEVTDNNAGRWGWGGTTTYLTKYYIEYFSRGTNYNLHNDIYKIYLETGILGTTVFTVGMFKICRKNYVSFIMMVYLFLEMFVNHQMGAGTFTYWVTLYAILFCFNNRVDNRLRIGKRICVAF